MNREVKSVCPYCGVGCGLVLKTDGQKILGISGDKEHPANFGRLCTKGLTAAIPLTAPDRLTQALAREHRANKLQPLPLAQAHQLIAKRIRTVVDQHGPDAFAFYVSGQMSTESQYLCNKLAKGFIGTNNIDSNSRLCMSSAASGYRLSLGADAPPGTYVDFEHSDCFLVIGSNMADCHPILFLRLLDRKKASGAKLIVVDPRRTATADKADLYLPIKPGTDMAFLNGLLHLLLQAGKVIPAFIEKYTEGWKELEVLLADYTPFHVAEVTGLSIAQIEQAAAWFGEAPEAMTLWTMGLNQSTHGTWHTNAICNLHLATGKIGRPGSGPFSLTGQPNAMGGREVGYLAAGLPGQREVMRLDDRMHLENLWGIPEGSIQALPGADAVKVFRNMMEGKIKALWIICTNPVASMPNRSEVIAGLETAPLVIVQDAFHPTETSRYADVILPAALWAEAEGTMVNSDRTVTLMQQAIPPPGDARPDWEHVARIAQLLGYNAAFNHQTASEVFEEIKTTFNLRTEYDLRGISYDQLRHQAMQWPCPPDKSRGKPRRYLQSDGSFKFATPSGKARFWARPFFPPAEMPDANFPFILNTGRLPHHWHTMTKTGKVEALMRLHPEPFVEVHPQDASELKIESGSLLKIESRRGYFIYQTRVTDRVQLGCCFASFHWNDLFAPDFCVNAVTSPAQDEISLQPELKVCAVRLIPICSTNHSHREQIAYLKNWVSTIPEWPVGQITLPESAPFNPKLREEMNHIWNQSLPRQ